MSSSRWRGRCGLAAASTLAAAIAALLAVAPPAWPVEQGPDQGPRGRAPALKVGDAAPEVVLETLDGDHVWLTQLKGKVVLLDFWASWCSPCIAALPSLKNLAQAQGQRPFVLLSVSGDAKGGRLREFVTNHELSWTQCWDGNGDAQRRYRVRSFPTYFLIDAAGRIRYLKIGWSRGAEKELRRAVDEALAAAAGPARAATAALR